MHINDQKAQSEALKQELIQKENANEQELADLKQKDAELAAQAQADIEAAAKLVEAQQPYIKILLKGKQRRRQSNNSVSKN